MFCFNTGAYHWYWKKNCVLFTRLVSYLRSSMQIAHDFVYTFLTERVFESHWICPFFRELINLTFSSICWPFHIFWFYECIINIILLKSKFVRRTIKGDYFWKLIKSTSIENRAYICLCRKCQKLGTVYSVGLENNLERFVMN